jgi:transmembrane sensor
MRDDTILASLQPPPEPELLERYLAGECSEVEAERVRAWAGVSSAGISYVDGARQIYRTMEAETFDATPMRREVLERLGLKVVAGVNSAHAVGEQTAQKVRSVRDPLPRIRRFGRGSAKHTLREWWSRAAIVAVSAMSVVIVTSFWWRTPASQSVAIYRTRATERATVTLPDGNRVLLAPQSTLTIQGTRATLSGEALFTIRHRENTPFIVRAGSVTVRVLGTAFDVRHYADERDTRVAVTEGKIELRTGAHPGGRAITMAAGRTASVSDSAVVLTNEVTNATRWTTGELVFTKASVRDVLRIASHWYGYTFRLVGRDSLALTQRHITVVFDERSVADAVRVLGRLLNATATVDSTGPGAPTITLRVDASVRAGAAVTPERRDLHDAFTTSREKGR